jgi:hypothetical protein
MNKALLDAMTRRHAKVKDIEMAGSVGFYQEEAELKTDSSGRAQLLCRFCTSDVDMDREVVVPDGVDDTAYWVPTGRNVYADHAYEVREVAARTRTHGLVRGIDGKNYWEANVVLLRNKYGDAIREILDADPEGGIGTSIGFIPKARRTPTPDEVKRYGNGKAFDTIVPACTMLEFSITAAPCNPHAMAYWDGERGTKRFNAIDSLLRKDRISRSAVVDLGFPDKSDVKPTTVLFIDG